MDAAVSAMQEGADDFLAKPIDSERLLITLANTLEKRKLEKLVTCVEDINRTSCGNLIGSSPEMIATYHIIESAAKSTASVMIVGESGTGKELAAQAVHEKSDRRNKPLIALNCAAIPHDLLESEIFGHIRGAFTGATADREGAAMQANGGTLFLDELTEMPMVLQSKLLRFIQTSSFSPVGSSKTISADIRFICATNRNPLEAVKNGLLREDLYYRLAVVPLHLPPLRARSDDIMMIARFFLEKSCEKEKKRFKSFDPDAVQMLESHLWPGNVRELENVIRYAVVMHDGDIITADMLHFSSQELSADETDESEQNVYDLLQGRMEIIPMARLERLAVENAIRICSGNITEAARKLGMNPSTIHRKLREWKSLAASA